MKVIIDSLDDAIVVFDKDLKSRAIQPGEALRLTGLSAEQLSQSLYCMTSQPIQIRRHLSAELIKPYADFEKQQPGYTRREDLTLPKLDGGSIHCSIGFIPITNDEHLDILVTVIQRHF